MVAKPLSVIDDVIDNVVAFSFFFVMLFQMLLCKLVGRKSWLEKINEDLYGDELD